LLEPERTLSARKEQSLDSSGWRDVYLYKILEQAVSAKKGSAGGLRQGGTGLSGAAGSAVGSSSSGAQN